MYFLVWPSKMDSFVQLIQKTYFQASVIVSMHVKMEQSSTEEFPTKQCYKCEERLRYFAMYCNWNLVAASTYNLEKTVGFPL